MKLVSLRLYQLVFLIHRFFGVVTEARQLLLLEKIETA